MFKKIFIISCSLVSGLLISCEKDIDIKLPYNGDKIVVNAIIKNDTTLLARITKSLPPEDNGRGTSIDSVNIRELEHVDAALYKDDVFIEKLLVKRIFGFKYFYSNHVFEKNKVYKLKVASPGLASVEGEDIIPENPAWMIKSKDKANISGEVLSRIVFEIDDPGKLSNYYRVKLFPVDERGNTSQYPMEFRFQGVTAENNMIAVLEKNDKKEFVFSDELFNGKKTSVTLLAKSTTSDRFSVEVSSVSKATYNYLNGKAKFDNNYGNPFAETVIMFNNIRGGYGIFGGMNTTSKRILQ